MATSDLLAPHLASTVVAAAGAQAIDSTTMIQALWSGYGQLLRCELAGGEHPSVIVKHVRYPSERDHPRGWATDRSHERKVRSYQVEARWYERYAARCGPGARVPRCLSIEARDDGVVMVMEDLDAAGFPERRQVATGVEIDAGLAWLATFHAIFMGERPDGLWETGTYWHLATRPDELDALADGPLKSAAAAIDQRLTGSPFQTLVHGDAKLANFCFTEDGRHAAAVDFQYVGGGCGMKDVAYFIGSCLDERDCERQAPELLDRYFELLRPALAAEQPALDAEALEADWRVLYPFAWTDFSRFLQGWSPGHWKLHGYSELLERDVLEAM